MRSKERERSDFRKEIEVTVGGDAGEVTDLYCRFTLPRAIPPPVAEWAGFVVSLCGQFRLRLGDEAVTRCSEADFFAAVWGNRNFRDFAASFGWAGRA